MTLNPKPLRLIEEFCTSQDAQNAKIIGAYSLGGPAPLIVDIRVIRVISRSYFPIIPLLQGGGSSGIGSIRWCKISSIRNSCQGLGSSILQTCRNFTVNSQVKPRACNPNCQGLSPTESLSKHSSGAVCRVYKGRMREIMESTM